MKILQNKWLLTLGIVAALLTACRDFEEMNYDPNKTSEVPTSALLTQAQANLVYNLNGEIAQLGAQYVQYFAQLDYPDKSNYLDEGVSSFNGIYLGGLTDLKEIISLNTEDLSKERVSQFGDNNNQIAVAKILSVWAYHSMTDVWGDLPYYQAISPDYLMPVYDTQSDVYDGLLSELNDAQALIDTDPVYELKGDLIFDGAMAKWDAFAESLKIRMAMRLTEVDDAKAKTLLQGVSFDNAFSTSSDYAHFVHLATEAEGNPLWIDNEVSAGGDYFACANTFIDVLNAVSDPRIGAFANPTANSGAYVGMVYGQEEAGNADDVSMPGDQYASQTAPTILMTAAEILFAKAEAIQRGYITGDAEAVYEQAIRVSMEYNGVGEADITTYLAQAEVQYDASNWRESIGVQKWIALFNQGIQGWAEWRRLDYPVLSPGAGASPSATIPRRRAYSSNEYTTNRLNVEAAVARFSSGKDTFNERVWWDK
ncbi:SusD/RagB family nutrient-binding outer membrane lipoprotein [Carboxylicivirga sp. A043]|uniref:SusD/RagB family nutrient-binding outer membrane lipoprotein n=1 Tax=Carboxylicivirga litoralis TaxID=2816963 RepID=UPI0021CB47DC|nr:SusD/RagB family nutrient-binding outer membrane lipoprotein [Carboxylicivirga sp. A043]MCU4156290.1 SusD/RagB family nutrient-binding outer membrane lipoprotein [Carboxylicivirga sp. A043]